MEFVKQALHFLGDAHISISGSAVSVISFALLVRMAMKKV
jgi:hypothetical protein